jgi:transposase
MCDAYTITNEQINDLPVLLGIIEELGVRRVIDAQIQPHGNWAGISVGTAVSVWLCHLLMERDHRVVSVREWASERQQTLDDLLGLLLRETDLTDDRLANVLTMLGDPADQAAMDTALAQDWMAVYALPHDLVRLDSTSVSVYHEDRPAESLLQQGHSKDHRPDLAQFKVMLASLDPLGLPLCGQMVAGQTADDGLYVPAYDAAVRTLGTAAVLVVGDSKMGALATRAHIVAGGSAYLCAYRPPRATIEIAGWIEQALAHRERWQELRDVDERTGEITPLAVIDAWERPQTLGGCTWTERVLVVRSVQRQAGLRRTREAALARLSAQLEALRLPPARGRTRYRTRAELEAVVSTLVSKARLDGVVEVPLEEEARAKGTRRWIVGAYSVNLAAWAALVARLGWHVSVTSTTPAQYTAPTLVRAYRQQVVQERGFARLKTRNLQIRPVYLHDEQRICGLTWLLTLALRVLTLVEYRLRTALRQRGESLVGLNPASTTQATQRPTTERVLHAFRNITRTHLTHAGQTQHHVTPLTPLQEHLLSLLQLPADLYARLGTAAPQPLLHLRE